MGLMFDVCVDSALNTRRKGVMFYIYYAIQTRVMFTLSTIVQECSFMR